MIKKAAITVSILFFVITCGIFGWQRYLQYSIIPAYEKLLWNIVNTHAHEIDTYLKKQEKNALDLSQESMVTNALEKFSSKNPLDGSQKQTLTTLFASHKEEMAFKNILLIDKTGTIIFATAKKDLVGENLKKIEYGNSFLLQTYERATMALTNDFSSFAFSDALKEPALFITIPILKEKKFIGALIYQLNQEKIYLISNQYIDLEKTGEVILAKKDGNNCVFLAPSRNDSDLAFKKTSLTAMPPLAIQAGILGKVGTGKAIDYRGKKVVGAWKFVPKVDWGILVKIDQDEILQPIKTTHNFLKLFLILLFVCLLFNIYSYYPLIRQKLKIINAQPPLNKIPPIMKNPFLIMLLICLGFTVKNAFVYEKKRSSTIKKAKQQAIENTTKSSEAIETILAKIAFVAQAIATDLRTEYLAKEDINTRIKRDLKENNLISNITVLFKPYAYNSTTELHVSSITKTEKGDYEENTVETENIFKTKWYLQALEKNSLWIVNPAKDPLLEYPTATYAYTFFDKNDQPNGVIAISFSLDSIIATTEFSGIGRTGYSIITADNGSFIFHPISNMIQTDITLLQYAQSNGNEELASIAQKMTEGKPILGSYSLESTKEIFWVYTHPIKLTHWTIAAIFSQDEIDLPSKTIRHYYFWILIWLTMTILFFFAFLWSYGIISLTYWGLIANIIILLALVCAWNAIQMTNIVDREVRTIITDQSTLNKFLNNLIDEADRKHEQPPINVPCGILLYSLALPTADEISISGYIWNKYNIITNKNIDRGMVLPQATKSVFGTPITSIVNNEETVTWNLQAVLFQEQNHVAYPFDQQQIRIILEHRDIEKNIILTPDLVAYKKISPESTPGLDKEFTLSGFTIEQTFFEYHKIEQTTNFGLTEYGKVTDQFQLIYNAIMNRNLLNPFILYFLPLLVILFSLFSTILVAGKNTDPLAILGGYTGLFFALVILQRSLREQHPAGTTLYMEYAFFYTYITIILLIIHTILMYYYKNWETYQNKSLHLIRIFFWPFQLIAWLLTTLVVFY